MRWKMKLSVLENFGIDLRRSVRRLQHAPGFALAAIALLALGMAGVTTLFAPLHSIVLSPLPFPHSDQLVLVGKPVFNVYTDSFPDRRSLDPVFSAISAYTVAGATLSGATAPLHTAVAAVTPEFFVTMGMQPWRGSDFAEMPLNAPVALVGHQFWRTHLAEIRDLSASSITLEGRRFAVIGVAQPGFDFPYGTQVWIPPRAPLGHNPDYQIIGRLRLGLSVGQAVTRLRTVATRAPAGDLLTPKGPELQSLQTYLLGDRQKLLWILSAVSVMFLLLACAGVANLLWARGMRRRQEMVMRLILGASRARLVQQFLTETLVLAVAGGLLGLGFSFFGIHFVGRLLPAALGSGVVHFSSASIGLVLSIVLAATILCGLAPAFQATGADLNASLKPGNSVTASEVRRRMITAPELLAGSQLALAMILLVSTALLLRSLTANFRISLGFEPQDVALFEADIPRLPEYLAASGDFEQQLRVNPKLRPDGAAIKRIKAIEAVRNELWYARAVDSLAATPGVISVGVIWPPPFTKGGYPPVPFFGLDPSGRPGGRVAIGLVRYASAEAFATLGIRLLAGRTFLPLHAPDNGKGSSANGLETDAAEFPDAAIVNKTLAKRFWPDQNPVGKKFRFLKVHTVVGVVSDIHESSDNLEVQPTIYLPFTPSIPIWGFVVKLRPGTPLVPLAAAVDRNLIKLIPGLAPPPVVGLSDVIAKLTSNLRLALTLLACFSALGIVVAGLGVYANAFEIAVTRTKEMGVRVALGASANQIRRLAIWRSVRIALMALPVGAFGSWVLGLSLSHWLFQVGAVDPVSSLACAMILLAVAFIAGLRPAFRTATVDPAAALRFDG